ncbi:MAG TPA: nickel pincer cofactor biosynthesis protein LarC, partial [Ktedonobacterales bacterium]|nr:nickel pincer cofactor biosynthesis protein LarC [Ktedonobacterales bacterium]
MIAYLDCFSGISGDMLLGALLDAGLSLDALRAGLASLPLTGYTLSAQTVTDHGISGIRAQVTLDTDAAPAQEHRRLHNIAMLLATGLAPHLHERAMAIFRRLAEAEGVIHGVRPEDVAFHEVGAVDSIVDIVGVTLGLDALGIDDLYCSELPLTSGRVQSAHGALPVPAPATLELLKTTGAVWRSIPAEGELVTPTGAAVLATLAHFERPTMRVRRAGYGFGSRTMPWANCLRIVLGEPVVSVADASLPWGLASADQWSAALTQAGAQAGLEHDQIVVIESNIDTMTGEALGWLMERLLAEGALDVSYSPLQMKKDRPATLLTTLATPDDAARLAALIVRESTTLGVRMRRMDRLKAGRRVEEIETPLG